uniref:Uncharacterized protein n=1 Tax=Arion vulgaris TaxID=1028688 RepID=A0A0B7A3D0_9EUPU
MVTQWLLLVQTTHRHKEMSTRTCFRANADEALGVNHKMIRKICLQVAYCSKTEEILQ